MRVRVRVRARANQPLSVGQHPRDDGAHLGRYSEI